MYLKIGWLLLKMDPLSMQMSYSTALGMHIIYFLVLFFKILN